MVRIALRKAGPRQAMKAHDEASARALALGTRPTVPTKKSMTLPKIFHALGQCPDIGRMIVIMLDEAKLRQIPRPFGPGGNGVEHGCRGGRRILRIKRNHEDSV